MAPGFEDGFFTLYGPLWIRAESDSRTRVRTELSKRHLNIHGNAHGGYLLALVDQVLFLGPAALGIEGALGGVTVDATSHFMTPVTPDRPVDLVVDILRETSRMIFMRGLIEQESDTAVAFTGVVRKAIR